MNSSLEVLEPSDLDFPVVGVGASAGGLAAFKEFVKAIPLDSGMAYVLVQHLDPRHESLLPVLLRDTTALPVFEITDEIKIKKDHIYIIPSNKILFATDGILKLKPRTSEHGIKISKPIDLFFESMALVYKKNGVGIILSGTGSDGTLGLKAIREAGGLTIVQEEDTAEWPEMPNSAIHAGVVDLELAPDEMPLAIKKAKENDNADPATWEKQLKDDEKAFIGILALLHTRKGTDFTYYKKNTLRRRIARRIVTGKHGNVTDYLEHVRKHKKEQDILYQDLLIPVTDFFRDTRIFEDICADVIPDIFENKAKGEPIRIWSVGCSTGQEAYSLAICLQEHMAANPNEQGRKLQIFATDISEPAIKKARKGLYSAKEIKSLGPKRIDGFFAKNNKSFQVKKVLRESCIFAVQNFVKDPPFGKIDLICCRNVLIYMQPTLQKKALTTFHYALNPQGKLLLGKSETGNSVPKLFEPINKVDKLFIRKQATGLYNLSHIRKREQRSSYKQLVPERENKMADFKKIADELLLSQYSPAGVVVNDVMEILSFRGNTSKFLEQQAGKPSHNLMKMARGGLMFELRSLMLKAKKDHTVRKESIPFTLNNTQTTIAIEITLLPNLAEPHYLVLFHEPSLSEANKINASAKKTRKDQKQSRIEQLEKELGQLREDMRSIIEDQEVANEELQTANEELLSGSEELQTLNEELETSKEELQSSNEELMVVNQELHIANDQLGEERNYAKAINKAIIEPLIVLDENLRVKSANSIFYETFKAKKRDTVGRLIFDLGNKQWDLPELRELLEEIVPNDDRFFGYEVVHEFEDIGSRTMLLNAQQILTGDGSSNLILLAIEDITHRKNAELDLKKSLHRYNEMIHSSDSIIAIVEGDDFILTTANGSMLEQLGKGTEIIGKPYLKSLPEFEEQGFGNELRAVYTTGNSYEAYEQAVEIVRKGKKELSYYNFTYQAQRDINGTISGVAIIGNEVTSQAEFNKKIKESEKRFHHMADIIPIKITNAYPDGSVYYFNQSWEEFTGVSTEKLINGEWGQVMHPDDLPNIIARWEHSVQTGDSLEMEFRIKDREGMYIWHLSRAFAVRNDQGEIEKWMGVNTQIQRIKEEDQRKKDFLKMVSHELKTPITSVKGYAQLLLNMLQEPGADVSKVPLVPSLMRIDGQVTKLTRLISEMLDIARMEDNQLSLQKKEFNLNELVVECVQDISYSSTEAILKVDQVEQFTVHADRDRVGQVLINFITNAIKYSPDNKTVEVKVYKSQNGFASVSIKDRGIGILAEDQKFIFDRFYRVSGKDEDTYSGFGIGLFLAKEIIERHKGFVEVVSKKGAGSTFTFKLPL